MAQACAGRAAAAHPRGRCRLSGTCTCCWSGRHTAGQLGSAACVPPQDSALAVERERGVSATQKHQTVPSRRTSSMILKKGGCMCPSRGSAWAAGQLHTVSLLPSAYTLDCITARQTYTQTAFPGAVLHTCCRLTCRTLWRHYEKASVFGRRPCIPHLPTRAGWRSQGQAPSESAAGPAQQSRLSSTNARQALSRASVNLQTSAYSERFGSRSARREAPLAVSPPEQARRRGPHDWARPPYSPLWHRQSGAGAFAGSPS